MTYNHIKWTCTFLPEKTEKFLVEISRLRLRLWLDKQQAISTEFDKNEKRPRTLN